MIKNEISPVGRNDNLVIVSDLDGTLLDHHTYRFDAAEPALAALKESRIPLVLNSSKTAAEILDIRRSLNNTDPFVVENGNGIYLPTGDENFEIIRFGLERDTVLEVLSSAKPAFDNAWTGMSEMSIDDICRFTGLEPELAAKAARRDFTEPLIWRGNEADWHRFCNEMLNNGLAVTRGGRFVHVSGRVDKGDAITWLRDYYRNRNSAEPWIVALGDSDNDREMLEAADVAVVICNPVHEPPAIKAQRLVISKQYGPEGWNTCVLKLLEQRQDINPE